MKLPIWVHQVGTSYGQSPLGFNDGPLPFSEVWGKVADGLNFMSTYDKHTAAIDGLAVVVAREQMHEREGGREWKPWVVARGQQPGRDGTTYATLEGELGGRVALAGAGAGETPVLIIDLEPHGHGGATPQFWRDDLMAGRGDQFVRAYCAAFKRIAPKGEIWICVDARGDFTDLISFAAWWSAPQVTRVLPMTYWTTFRRPVRQVLETALSHLQARGVRPHQIAPVLPGAADAISMLTGIAITHELGMLRPSIWQRGNLSRDTAAAIADHEDDWASDPTPTPPAVVDPDEARQRVEDAGDALVEVQQVVSSAIADLAAAAAALEERSTR